MNRNKWKYVVQERRPAGWQFYHGFYTRGRAEQCVADGKQCGLRLRLVEVA